MPKNSAAAGEDGAPFSVGGIRQLGSEAFLFGFPLLTMAARMRQATTGGEQVDGWAPVNEFAHLNRFPDPTLRALVATNAHTLYSLAWLDLEDEPILLELPDTGARSYLLPLIDAWTNVIACLGPRTSADTGGTYALTGPSWTGRLPHGARRIDAPTNRVWAMSHIHSLDDGDDLALDRAIQHGLRLTPLSASEALPPPPTRAAGDGARSKSRMVTDMGAEEFLTRLAAEMGHNPPTRGDFSVLERLTAIGVRPGEPFDWAKLSEEVHEALQAGILDGRAMLATGPARLAQNGWETHGNDHGPFGVDYRRRAQVASFAPGTIGPEDASFRSTLTDSDGNHTNGGRRYTIRFDVDELPPVNALWSLALYDMDQLVVDNEIDRYALGDRDGMDIGADGSVEIAVQHDRPEGSDANWLPAPEGDFNLMLHMYWPGERVLDGSWTAPSVRRVG